MQNFFNIETYPGSEDILGICSVRVPVKLDTHPSSVPYYGHFFEVLRTHLDLVVYFYAKVAVTCNNQRLQWEQELPRNAVYCHF
jgi:hypothetical protein